jgi:DNA-binding NarL/FixJ family response regulator
MTTSVILVDDHELIRQGLRRAFERDETFEVVGEAGTGAEARSLVDTLRPDVAIVDIRLPDVNGLELAKELRAKSEQMGIVVLTMYSGDEHLFGALEAGASAFVAKDSPAEDIVAAARHAAVSPRAFTASDLADAMRRRLEPTGPRLSPREMDVLTRLAQGLSVAQIAGQLYISESTTKTHISKIYDKLGATNRAQALMTALRLGLIKQETPDRP